MQIQLLVSMVRIVESVDIWVSKSAERERNMRMRLRIQNTPTT